MIIFADAFDNAGNFARKIEGGSRMSIFRQAQSHFGHCLGRLEEEGILKGWRFAKCKGNNRCSRVEIFNVILEEGAWQFADQRQSIEEQIQTA